MNPWKSPFANAIRDLRQPPPGNMPVLDILRSVAILLVLSLHVGEGFPAVWELPFVNYGWSGVDLFFVLSGYLIGGQLWKELARRGDVNVGRFILRRGYRIWPLYYSFILGVGGVALIRGQPVRGFTVDLLCVSNYFHHKIAGGWSLSTEEQFYILVPTLLYVGCRVMPLRQLIALPALWLVLLPVMRWLAILRAPGVNPHDILYFPFHLHSDGLAVGLILAWVGVNFPGAMKPKRWQGLLTLAAGLALGLALRRLNQAVFRFSSLAIIYGAITFFVLGADWLPNVKNWRGFYVISRLSYGMYLNQFHVVDIINPWVKPLMGLGVPAFVVSFLLCLAGALVWAYVTFALIEMPFLTLRRRWTEGSRARTPQMA